MGIVENVPLNEGTAPLRFTAEGAASRDEDDGVLLNLTWTGGDYFRTMGIAPARGAHVHAGRPDLGHGSVDREPHRG